ncbi:MAG: ATP-dependent Clp protease proteolytic subunit, partial [Planctomycetota bacterium]
PHARVMIHQPYGGVEGQVSDIEIQADEILRNRKVLNDILAAHTGKSFEVIAKDMNRDFFLTAEAAKAYGIVDEITIKPKADDDDNLADEKAG